MSDTGSHTSTIIDAVSLHQDTIDAQEVFSGSADEKADPFLVQFDVNDPANPKNWSSLRRWYLTCAGGLLVLNATFASSAPSGILLQLMDDFHMVKELGVLALSLFIAGYCVGPLLWGPLSEQYGRRPVFIYPFLIYTVFQVAAAVSQTAAQMLIFRFLGGVFAAAPLTNSGAIISDIWDAQTRGKALAIFTLAPFAGPALGPTVAGYIAVGGASWRWLFWVLAIFAGLCWLQIVFTIPETYAPVLLAKKAKQKRKETGDERYYAPIERIDLSFGQRMENILAKPFKILFQEPMLLAITVYMSFVYGCLYLLFEAYPVVFTEGHHFNAGASGLMFLPIPLGGVVAVAGCVFYFNPRYEKAAKEYAPHPVPPEIRLEMAKYGAPFFAIAFFWFAWTSSPSISYWAPMMAGLLLGFSICWNFLSLIQYIIDVYLSVAATALAGNTVCRSLFGAAFPLFAGQMYDSLGAKWASSLLGFIALVMMPIPLILIKFGPTLRKKSKHAPTKHIGNVPLKEKDSSSLSA